MALWDIKGKAFSLPLYRLLGGKFRSELRCYASQLQSGWKAVREKCREPQEYAEAALAAKEQGYDAVKNAKNLRTCIHNLNRPPVRAFSRPAALKNLEIHKVFLRFFALQGEKIPRPSGIFGCEYRF